MKGTIIFNPKSGRERGAEIAGRLATKLSSDFSEINILKTKDNKSAQSYGKLATDKGQDSIFVIGGDGTVGDVVTGINTSKSKDKPTLGILPGGTMNGISRMLGFPSMATSAINALDLSKTELIDYSKCNGKSFLMIYSIGDIPESIHSTNSDYKQYFSFLAYFVNIARNSTRNSNYNLSIKLDNEKINGSFNHVGIMTSNTLESFAPTTINFRRNDGKLHIFLIEESNLLDKMLLFPDIALGQLHSNENLVYRQSKEVKILSDEKVITDLDGDRFKPVPSYIKIVPKGLKVYTLR